MRVLLLFVVLLACALGLTAWWVSRPVFDEPLAVPDTAFEILPVDRALTVAMSRAGEVYLVISATPSSAEVVDINAHLGTAYADTLAAYAGEGYDTLAALAQGEAQQVPLTTLGIPLYTTYPHIAAGTNFRAHAEEVGLDGEPFLFPKLSRATPWDAVVPLRTRLDFEVELCAVPLVEYAPSAPAALGYLLCNDFTDRWTLLREIDLDSAMGRSGFPDAKGGEGMLPVGPFLAIPRDHRDFPAELQLGLGRNGELQQRSSAGLMVWSPDDIAQRALADCTTEYRNTSGTTRLTDCERIAPGALLLTGTPEGVLFHFLNVWSPFAYLRGGDEVVTYADHLGILRSQIR